MVHTMAPHSEFHDLGLAGAALAICAIGCWTTATLLDRTRCAKGRRQDVWILASSIEFGLAVWASHFMAILALHADPGIHYDLGWTILSIILAVSCSSLGFVIAVKTPHRATGGLVLGVAVGLLHFSGVQAMSGDFRFAWDGGKLIAAFMIGLPLTAMAMTAKQHFAPPLARVAKTSLLMLAILAIHFLGMAAMRMVRQPGTMTDSNHFPPGAIAVVVGAIATLVVVLGLLVAYVDLYVEHQRRDENKRLRAHIAALEAARLEQGLALESAWAANRSKTAFLAAMSHELRTPLNAIIGFSEMMATEPFGALGHPRYRVYSNDIASAGNHLLSLINDILDISKLEARKAELAESIVDLPELLSEALRLVEPQSESAEVALSLYCNPALPRLRGDARRLKQVVLNLLSNGVKFTPGGGHVAVHAGPDAQGGVTITVTDNGIGIAPNDICRAFESFGQIDNRLSRKYEGSGLGLPLARHLVELHGGTLEMASELHVGTTMTIRLPQTRCLPLAGCLVA